MTAACFSVVIKPLIEGISASRLGLYSGWCGWALARSHAKAGDPAMISGYLGSNVSFDKAVAAFALTYAEQNERDFKALLKAIRGRPNPGVTRMKLRTPFQISV